MLPNVLQKGIHLIVVALIALGATLAQATVIVPGTNAAVEGDSNNGFPFNLSDFGLPSQHYQQVYAASEFGSGPLTISGLVFRPDGSFGHAFGPTTLSGVTISLSTTNAGINGLSPTYANNVGQDSTVVVSGDVILSSAFTGPAGGPMDFDISIMFSNFFTYDPQLGNLLLDVLMPVSPSTSQFDAVTSSQVMSRLFNTDVSSLTGAAVSGGLVTQFATTSVPEPGTIALIAMGLAAVGLGRSARTRCSEG